MKGWTLEYIGDLDEDVYHELVDWINESNRSEDDDSIDIDELMDAQKKAREREAADSGG